MAALGDGDQGYVSPDSEDGAAIAAADDTSDALTLEALTVAEAPEGVSADPTGNIGLHQPAAPSRAKTLPMTASRASVESAVRALLQHYTYAPSAVSSWTGKRGFVQVRAPAVPCQPCSPYTRCTGAAGPAHACVDSHDMQMLLNSMPALSSAVRTLVKQWGSFGHYRGSVNMMQLYPSIESMREDSELQVLEWIIELPHPVRLRDDEERAQLAIDIERGILAIEGPAGTMTVAEKAEDATTLLAGGVSVSSSAGGASVYLNTSMSETEGVRALTLLQGLQDVTVLRTGHVRTGWEYKVTFAPTKYAAGNVPVLSIVSDNLQGANCVFLELPWQRSCNAR